MATLGEIENALAVLACGYLRADFPASFQEVQEIYVSAEGQKVLQDKVQLLHCTTQYPAPAQQANLLAMDTIKRAFDLPVGYSDHTEGITIPVVAVARGAQIIEKHFTLDKDMPGPDHKASLEAGELKSMVQAIREVEQAISTGIKIPAADEIPNITIVRKCLVTARDISTGEVFSQENLTAKRAGKGISPMDVWNLLGEKAKRDYKADGMHLYMPIGRIFCAVPST